MTQQRRIQNLRTRFFASTAMGILALQAVPVALADDHDEGPSRAALEARIIALESRLDRLLTKLEAGDAESDAKKVTSLEASHSTNAGIPHADKTASITSVPAVERGDGTRAIALLETDSPGGVSAQQTKPKPSNKLKLSAGDTDLTFKGYVKLDTTISNFSGGDLPSSSLGRDFYIPGLIPVGGTGDGPDFDFNPRETRFIFAVDTNRGGHDIGGLIELDFQVTSDGNERVSNSFTPRMRQAYITIDNWLLGQAWSTFQDVSALPDNLDFIGPTEGTVFIRQPMIRYTKGPFQIAIEQPETEVTGPNGGRLLPGDDVAPDVVARYNMKRDWGHFTLAGIGRALHVEENIVPGAESDTIFGFGVSASGKIKVGPRDDFRFMATYGEGIGRYVGVNIVNDVAVGLDGQLQTIPTYSGFASYRHFWTDRLRSNLTGGYFKADNPIALVGDTPTDEVYSAHVNLIYQLVNNLEVGIEYIYANRTLENGADGDLNRVQFSTKYSF
ncbi:MAG: DcaP family trimeric outer membrane transporter [Pseudomonadota bacterium]